MAGLITDKDRISIKRLITHAAKHPCPLDLQRQTPLEQFEVTISGYRVYYLHHQRAAHLSVHGKAHTKLPDMAIEEIAAAFGFGSKKTWHVLNRPEEPSVHIFRPIKEINETPPAVR